MPDIVWIFMRRMEALCEADHNKGSCDSVINQTYKIRLGVVPLAPAAMNHSKKMKRRRMPKDPPSQQYRATMRQAATPPAHDI
jgi:hypothetical protein